MAAKFLSKKQTVVQAQEEMIESLIAKFGLTRTQAVALLNTVMEPILELARRIAVDTNLREVNTQHAEGWNNACTTMFQKTKLIQKIPH